MRATWLEPLPVRGFLGVHRARDFATFRDAFRSWPGPSLNVVYADVDGHIGWQLVGTLPRRRTAGGLLPQPAWEGGWEAEHLPYDDLPWVLDPPAGFVVSANNAPRADDADAPYLGADWLDGYRAARITEVLADRIGWDVERLDGAPGRHRQRPVARAARARPGSRAGRLDHGAAARVGREGRRGLGGGIGL